jgi:succinate-semialdehyde dehydrogenase/glutarate-semialdehyde dehydrogenase
MPIVSRYPATGELIQSYDEHTPEEVEQALERAVDSYRSYRLSPVDERASTLLRAAELLVRRREDLGELMAREMGKPIGAAVAEVEKCALVCRYYAEHGPSFLADEQVETSARRSWVRYEPLGVVFAIMPWNFPFWQVFRFAAPALMAGNVGLLKHASNVPGCALEMERLLADAGLHRGVFQTLLISSGRVQGVLEDRRVAAVTLTGSEPAGRAVARTAGENLKKTVLELGGSDPFIVMPSADLAAAARTAVRARVINNGQSCIAAKRFLVHEEVADVFERLFVSGMAELRVGDPLDPATDVGPLATQAIRDELHRQVQETVRAGARVLLGGVLPEGPGYFYPPTVLTEVPAGSPAHREELFGPVAALFRVSSAEDAVRVANDTDFGLGAAAWTASDAESQMFVAELEAGSVFVNGMVASDPRLPFGGVKSSGHGRELGIFGLREFLNIKTVWIES